MKKIALLIILFQIATVTNAEVININFHANYCYNDNYDTIIPVNVGDTLNFYNKVPGTVNLFVYINGIIEDTLSVGQNKLILQHVVTSGDTLIRISLWTYPGTCYGNIFHLNNMVNILEKKVKPQVYIDNHLNYLTIHNTIFKGIYIYDLQGKLILQKRLLENGTTRLSIFHLNRGIYIVLFKSKKLILKRKIAI